MYYINGDNMIGKTTVKCGVCNTSYVVEKDGIIISPVCECGKIELQVLAKEANKARRKEWKC